MNSDKQAFSERLKILFGEERGAIAQIANRTGFAYQVVESWYKGRALPKYEGLQKIAEATGCDLNWLLTGEGKQPERVCETPPEYLDDLAELAQELESLAQRIRRIIKKRKR